MVLTPDVRRQQVVERCDRRTPANALAGLQPLGVLVEHRIDDVHEGFVRREQTVASGQQVAFEPALAGGFAQDLHRAPVRRQVIVGGKPLGHPHTLGDIEDRPESIGGQLVRRDDAKVAPFGIQPHDVAQERAKHPGGLAGGRTGPRHC